MTGASAAVGLTITEKARVADDVVTVRLVHPDGARLRDWTPGSHIDLVLDNGLTRQYSLCGDRFDPYSYTIGVLREPRTRGGSAHVHDTLAVGDRVTVGGPRNNFPLVPSGRYRFIAGGIGITPILPMIEQAEMVGADWRLLYGGRRRGSMAFAGDLERYGEKVRLAPHDECGLLDLAQFIGAPRGDTRIYCCGPEPLLVAARRACAKWEPLRLRTERFVATEGGAPARPGPFTVELARSRRTVLVSPEQTVLDAVAGAGAEVLCSCRQGVCGTCETAVLAGRPDHRDSLLDADERATGRSMLICVSRSLDDRLVLDL